MTVTSALPPAGTVTVLALRANGPVPDNARLSVTSAAPELVNVTVLVDRDVACIVRPGEVAEERRTGGLHRVGDCCGDVEAAGAHLVRRVEVREPLAAAHQRVLELLTGPVRVPLRQDRRCARDVRGRHRGAVDRPVHPLAAGHLLRPGRGDGDAGSGDVRLDGAGAGERAGAGEPGQAGPACRPRQR